MDKSRIQQGYVAGLNVSSSYRNPNEIEIELPYISCKNLALVIYIRHYLQESCKYLTFQTKPVRFSFTEDIFYKFIHFLHDFWTNLARQCLKIERNSARNCLECTETVRIFFQF